MNVVRCSGRICVLDIEIEGVKQVKSTDLNPLLVFVMPPSIEELERRLRARNTEQEDALRKRLETARKEIEYGEYFSLIFFKQYILTRLAGPVVVVTPMSGNSVE